MKLPEFHEMSKIQKDYLISRFRPEYCPNCGREITAWHGIGLECTELISSVPAWNIDCRFCGVEYQVRIVQP